MTALLGRGFRPFFGLASLYAIAIVARWVAVFAGWQPAPVWLLPTLWHGHEMLFGVVVAAIAGFLLTSVPVWTGTTAVAGARLGALVALWAAGRVALWAADVLPAGWVAAVDLAFLPALLAAIAPPIASAGQRRNWGIVGIVTVLFGINAALHAQALGWSETSGSTALRVAADLVIVLITVIGGRIVPTFTANAFRSAGVDAALRGRDARDTLAIAAVVAVAVCDVAVPRTVWSGGSALLAAVAIAARMLGWQTLRTGRDPLIWSLHAGYAWVAVGLLAVGLADLTYAIPYATGLHALTAGAMGSMILAVMTRVALGHTGRPLALPPGAVWIYALVHAGAGLRVLGPIFPSAMLPLLVASGTLWAGAFGLYAALYARILTAPRADGAQG